MNLTFLYIYATLLGANGAMLVVKDLMNYKYTIKRASEVFKTKDLNIQVYDKEFEQVKAEYKEKNENFKKYLKAYEDLLNQKPHINKYLYNKNISETTILFYSLKDKILSNNGGSKTLAYYDYEKKIISLRKSKYEKNIWHELSHLSTTTMVGDIYFSGFTQCNSKTKQKIGYGLNEAFTEVFARENFNVNSKAYDYVYTPVLTLSNIIGMEKMETLYFNCDLAGLVDELHKYGMSHNEIHKFILNLDYLVEEREHTPHQSPTFKKYQDEIKQFLIKLYINKSNMENPEKDDSYYENLNKESRDFILQYYEKPYEGKRVKFKLKKEQQKIESFVDDAIEEEKIKDAA